VGLESVTYYVTVADQGCISVDTIIVTFEECVGIEEISNELNLELFPNPSSGIVTIKFTGSITTLELFVVDLYGQVLYLEKFVISSENFYKQLDLSGLPKGLYFIKLKADNKLIVEKILIQ
ncbi:unnamed protein product, partial [marine sediment metagenome]